MTQCNVSDGAEHSKDPTLRRGMCQKHYLRWKRDSPNYESRFEPRTRATSVQDVLDITGYAVIQRDTPYAEGPCWEWCGSRFSSKMDYGRFVFKGENYKAHRAAYEAWVGPIPEGLVVRHKCDNPPCINPDHLELGTHKDNVRDMMERGRYIQGHQFLSEQDVLNITERVISGERVKDLSVDFGVHESQIQRIASGKAFRNIPRNVRKVKRLSDEAVLDIRRTQGEVSNKDIAARYGIDPSTVSHIRSGRRHRK